MLKSQIVQHLIRAGPERITKPPGLFRYQLLVLCPEVRKVGIPKLFQQWFDERLIHLQNLNEKEIQVLKLAFGSFFNLRFKTTFSLHSV